jgi:hypothetical protein
MGLSLNWVAVLLYRSLAKAIRPANEVRASRWQGLNQRLTGEHLPDLECDPKLRMRSSEVNSRASF